MASFASTTNTTGEKRKKPITYGKSSRLPPSRPNFIEQDALSSEQSRKSTPTSSGSIKSGSGFSAAAQRHSHSREATSSSDVFDVPSEDEFEPQSKPAKKPTEQRSKTEGIRTSASTENSATLNRPFATASRPPKQHGAEQHGVVNPARKGREIMQEQITPQQSARTQALPPRVSSTRTIWQTKALQPNGDHKQTTTHAQPSQRSNTVSKHASRATTPGLSTQPAPGPQTTAGTTSTEHTTQATKSAVRQPASLDVFDLPPDEEDAFLPTSGPPRQGARHTLKGNTKVSLSPKTKSFGAPQKVSVRPNELGGLQNRKRKGSLSSTTAPKPVSAGTREHSIAQRDRKAAKREKEPSPAYASTKFPELRSPPQAASVEPVVNKPRRTRTRTVPVISRSGVSKGQSSPAMLHRLVPKDETSTLPLEDITSEIPASHDTMYDIPEALITPVRPTSRRRITNSTPGSVTPRQKDLFSTLLGNTAAPKTPASALASLQLTDKKSRSLLGALARSKSDLTFSSQSKRARLIATFNDEGTSSSNDESGSDDDADDTILADATPRAKATIVKQSTLGAETEETTAADSQTSQTTSSAITRPRFTYAAQRSYLQEANPEDEFLLSMDIDDSWKIGSQSVSTDDEDGPTSQVRTHHELKKYGQNTMFSWDMEESIREVSDDSSKTTRRSAMMELCTKMADTGFISQLLDSGFTHKLLENMTSKSTGDVIFGFFAIASILFILQTKPTSAVVDQIHRSGMMATMIKFVDDDADVSRIARDRKSNMSKIAQESLAEFRALVLVPKVWSSNAPEKISPQLLALKAIDLLIRNLRESGSTEALLAPTDVSKIVSICSRSSSRVRAAKAFPQDLATIDLALSILETVSIAERDYSTWPTEILQQLAEIIPVVFEDGSLSKIVEAMKLCMNLTNNKPKACQPFSGRAFVQPLLHSIVGRFELLHTTELDTELRAHVSAALTLGLGAMINLAELSDQARLNTIDDRDPIEVLVKTFVVGSERAAQADSVEESEFSVQIGFLTVLLGNMCLNSTVRSKVRASLPSQQLQPLLNNMKEFARIHEHVDKRTASRFEGSEGQEALNNYYIRIMHVVKKLEGTKD